MPHVTSTTHVTRVEQQEYLADHFSKGLSTGVILKKEVSIWESGFFRVNIPNSVDAFTEKIQSLKRQDGIKQHSGDQHSKHH